MQAACTDILEKLLRDAWEVRARRQRNRIRMVRRKLAEDWYDREDLLDVVLERILVDLSVT